MTQQGETILAVDDDPLTCRMVEFLLQSHGYKVITTSTPANALSLIDSSAPDLVLLDVQLPQMDGFALMRHIGKEHPGLPVIMLTAKAEMPYRLTGFDAGADDYVVKPFDPAELLARVQAVLRRAKMRRASRGEDGTIDENGIVLDPSNLSVRLPNGHVALLTPTEARILHKLMANPNHVVSRDDIAMFAGGYISESSYNNVDVYIGRLRRKLQDDANNPQYIVTVRGRGYKFVAPKKNSG